MRPTGRRRPASENPILHSSCVAHFSVVSGVVTLVGVQRAALHVHEHRPQGILQQADVRAIPGVAANTMGYPMLVDDDRQFQRLPSSVRVVFADALPSECILDVAGVDAVMRRGAKAFVRFQSASVCRIEYVVLGPHVHSPEERRVMHFSIDLSPLHPRPEDLEKHGKRFAIAELSRPPSLARRTARFSL